MKYVLPLFLMVSLAYAKATHQVEKVTFIIEGEIPLELNENSVGIKEGDHVDDGSIEEEVRKLRQSLYSMGYLKLKIDYRKIVQGDGVEVVFVVSVEKIAKVVDLKLTSDNVYLLQEYKKKVMEIKDKPFSNLRVKIILDELGKEIFDSGYYYSSITFKKKMTEERQASVANVSLDIHLQFGLQYNFYFKGNTVLNRFELVDFIRQSILTNKNDDPEKRIKLSILEIYKSLGIYGTMIKVRSERAVSINNKVTMKNFFITIEEGKKLVLKNFIVEGNVAIPLEEIEKFYYEKSTSLASQGYYDKDYLLNFVDVLKKEYLKRGFVLADVSVPEISQNENEASVVYNINEQKQCILRAINLEGIDAVLKNKIKEGLTNKENQPLNILEIENDIKKAMDIVRAEGYFFAKIKKTLERDIVIYSPKGASAELNVKFVLGKKGLFKNVYIRGDLYTNSHVIEREVHLVKNEIITLEKIDSIREKINGLGLFSQVKITPQVANKDDAESEFYEIDLLIEVDEKDFGNAEFSLGYRTDIGIKLSAVVSHSNLWRENHSVSTKGQVNQRLDYNSLDLRRRSEKKNRLEGLWEANYVWPYFISTIDLNTRIGFERKRFFAFDADILRFAPQISKKISSHFSASLGYQFERINQFDATEEKDRDTFKIGSVTPSLTLDYRDHPIKPRRGAFFRLSWEFANPNFGFNRDDENNKIDFSKLILRNKFYISRGPWSLALSLVGGVQWNWAKEWIYDDEGNIVQNEDGSLRTVGHIPSIKVFRLDGIDAVRGFSYEEINRTYSGEDISELRIQDRAYFTNIKLEPRYYWQDSLAMGIFLDAGGLSVNHYKPLKLRTAAGLSLKILTLVGTLDFDYGIKLHRRHLASGVREKFGRFHLSIGHF